ncbi:MAG: nitroreductase family protein [Deltaproteobacteria bacterium]|nr:nitroreductase family protein [Deltaproteobacteria bacterium]
MDFMSVVQKRRSIRRYQDRRVEPEKVDDLVEAALRAPTSRGTTSWRFIVVEDPATLAKLSRARDAGSAQLKKAALAIVICTNPEESTVWVEDASIAGAFILLAAEDLGLGGCWIQVRERFHSPDKTTEAYISEILGIPGEIRVVCVLSLGYPAETKKARGREELLFGKVYRGGYGKPYR